MDSLSLLENQIKYNAHNEHMNARNMLRKVCSVCEFNKILNDVVLTDDERVLIEMHYLKGYELSYIADHLGYSEKTIKRWHNKILLKISNTIK